MKLKWFLLLVLMTVIPSSLFSNTLYFPQVAFGDGYSTTFVITNTGTSTVTSTVNFYDKSGASRAELNVPVNLPAGNSTRFTIPNGGSGITVVWGQLAAGAGTVQGVATFDLRAPNGTLITTAGVLGLEAGNSFLLPVDVTSPTASTGIAFANVNAGSSVTVNLRLLGEAGNQVATATEVLTPRQQLADFATKWFQQQVSGSFRGSLVVEAASGAPANSIAATALTVKEGILSALPVIPSGGSAASAGKTLYFPQVAFGAGYSTTFVIMNTGSSSVSSTVNFYDQNGVNRLDLSRAVNIPANGSARLTLPNTDPNNITVVWGEIAPGAGRTVRGVATFDLRAPNGVLITTAGVLGLEAGNSFNLPVDVTAASSTGIAIGNAANAGVNVRLRLLGEDAAEVATANDPIFSPLASKRQTANFVTKWFPQLVGTTFKGTLVVEALAGAPANSLAATALTTKEGVLSALPVNPGSISGPGGGGTGGSGGGGGGGGGGGVVGGGAASDCLDPSLYSSVNTIHFEHAFTGSVIGSVVSDITHTPNVVFEGQSANEWATSQVANYPALGTFPSNSKSYHRLEGLEFVSFGSIVDVTTPIVGTSKIVFSPPFRSKRYTLAPGESLTQTYSSTTTATYVGLPPFSQTTSVTQTERYLGQESVTVTAGTFNTCKFETANQTTWEAVGKGILIKSISLDNTGGSTTLQLTSGTINGSPIVP